MKPNPLLDTLLASFKPQFGNQKHIDIIERIGKVRKLRASVLAHDKRVNMLKKQINSKTIAEKNLEKEEKTLLSLLST